MISQIWRLAVYLAVGAFWHWIFVGDHFDWSAAVTYCWLALWPLMLIWYAFKVVVVIFLAVLVIAGILSLTAGGYTRWGR